MLVASTHLPRGTGDECERKTSNVDAPGRTWLKWLNSRQKDKIRAAELKGIKYSTTTRVCVCVCEEM